MKFDVAIVGAGPAGLKAAIEIARAGGNVVMIDDHPHVGGKLNGQLHEEPNNGDWWIGVSIAEQLKQEALSLGITILTGTQVWSVEEGWKLFISNVDGRPLDNNMIESKALLLATGAIEKPLPLPGWTLPGVLTIGGAQVLTNQYQVKPGNRVIVVGVDILSLSIARAMKMAGADVVGIYIAPKNEFTSGISNPKELLSSFSSMTKFAPNLFMRLGGNVLKSAIGCSLAALFYPKNGMKVWDIPIHFRQSILAINGEQEVESVTLTKIDPTGNAIGESFLEKVDAVCISGGLSPQNELAAVAGCEFVRLNGLSGVVPLHDQYMQTTVEGLFVAGNITGIEGAKVASAQGVLAGSSINKYLSIGNVNEGNLERNAKQVEIVRETADITFHSEIGPARNKLQKLWEHRI